MQLEAPGPAISHDAGTLQNLGPLAEVGSPDHGRASCSDWNSSDAALQHKLSVRRELSNEGDCAPREMRGRDGVKLGWISNEHRCWKEGRQREQTIHMQTVFIMSRPVLSIATPTSL